jgi:hypothetical protein
MNVVRLLPRSANHETVAALKALAARAERGEVLDIALAYTDSIGREKAIWTGRYKDAEVALRTALHWSSELVDQAFQPSSFSGSAF